MDIKEDYNLRENADITYLAMRCAESKDPTELKKWFDAKYNTTDKVNDANTSKEECTLYCISGCSLPKCTRVEVIDKSGRAYTNYSCKSVKAQMQDEERTLKVVIS